MLAPVEERNARSSHERRHRAGHQHLAGTGQGRHPGADVNGHPGYVVASDLDLTCVDTGPHVNVEGLQRLPDGHGALDRPTRTVEGGYEAVAHRLYLATPIPLELRAHALVVAIKEIPPPSVPEPRGPFGGADDVGEQHRGEDSLCSGSAPDAGDALLDLVEHLSRVADPEETVGPW